MLSIEIMLSRVIMFRASHFNVSEVIPNFTTSIPISIISPCFAELLKFISDMYLVTILVFSN